MSSHPISRSLKGGHLNHPQSARSQQNDCAHRAQLPIAKRCATTKDVRVTQKRAVAARSAASDGDHGTNGEYAARRHKIRIARSAFARSRHRRTERMRSLNRLKKRK